MKYEDYITRSILANNEFGIKEVRDIEELKAMSLIRENYPKIVELVKNKDINSIKNLPPAPKTFEFIAILQFIDQNGHKYIVTTYDSDAIYQDPQVIDIFKI